MTNYLNPSTRHGGVDQIVVPERAVVVEVDEAPFNDTEYVRVNGEWRQVTEAGLVPDTLAPSPPTSLSSSGTIASGGNAVNYALTWVAPTTNVDTTPLTDLAYYVVRWRYTGTGPWTSFVSNDPTALLPGLVMAVDVEWAVLARDLSGNDSTWTPGTSTGVVDTAGPAKPSIPVLSSRLGTITVTWDGLDYVGALPPVDFSHLALYISATTGGPWAYAGRVSGAGPALITSVPVGQTRYITTLAVDTSSNASVRSAEASITVVGITGPDIVAGSVTADKINVIPGGVNLFANSGFEADSNADGTADSWTKYNNSEALQPTTLSRTAGRSGGYAQRVTWAVANTTVKGLYQALGPRVASTYVLSVWARGSVTVAGGLMPANNPPSPTNVVLNNPNLSATVWQRYAWRMTWAATPETNQFFAYSGAGTGWVEFDDVQFEEGDLLTAYSPKVTDLLPGTITALMLKADAITGKTITGGTVTGALIRTVATGQRMEISSVEWNKILAYSGRTEEIAPAEIRVASIAGADGETELGLYAADVGQPFAGRGSLRLLARGSGPTAVSDISAWSDYGTFGYFQWAPNFVATVNVPLTYAGEDWIPAVLTNSWANFGGSFPVAQSRKMADGTVMLRGVIKSGTPFNAFVLPYGHRPASQEVFLCAANGGGVRVDVFAGGGVQIVSYIAGGTNAYVSLSGIRFPYLVL